MTQDPTDKVRAFVAIELNGSLRRALADLQERLRRAPQARPGRWVDAANIHLTLRFLGDVPQRLVPELVQALVRACEGVAPLEAFVRGLGCFPNDQRPRVLWVGLEEPSGQLSHLQAAVESELERLGIKREGRSFSPHLTLARLRDQTSARERADFGAWIRRQPPVDLGALPVEQVALMQSILRPEGAQYRRLGVAPLRAHVR